MALDGELSSEVDVISGVPQGTVLGPLLFLAFINDLPGCVKDSFTKLFADDCLLFKKITSQTDSLKLQGDLTSLENWEETWQMHFNPSKCTTLRMVPVNYTNDVLETTYNLHGQQLEVTPSSKYLGVNLDDKLTWKGHIQETAAKGNRILGFLKRNFRECNMKVRASTYKTMVRPVLEYAGVIWDPTSEQNKKTLEDVQRNAARFVCNNYTDRYPGAVTNMLNTLQWDSLEERRLHQRLLMLYKINSGIVDVEKSSFYKPGDPRTRGSQNIHQDLFKHPSITDTFFPRTISQWNRLPTRLTESPSMDFFRANLGEGAQAFLSHR